MLCPARSKSVCMVMFFLAVFNFTLSAMAAGPAPAWLPGFPMRAGGMVIIMWAPVPGATEYRLMKKVDSGEFQEVYKGPTNNYSDAAAPQNKTITYKIIAMVAGQAGEPSKEAVLAGIKPLDAPEITGVLPDSGGLRIRWAMVAGASFYNIYRSESESGSYKLITSLQEPQYYDREPKPGKPFFYRISAVDKTSIESEKSKVVLGKIDVAQVVEVSKPVYKEVTLGGEFRGQPNNELQNPVAIFVNGKGELVVLEQTGVQFLDPSGVYLRRVFFEDNWGFPVSGYLAPNGELFVTFANDIVRKVDMEGKQIAAYTIKPNEKAASLAVKLGPVTLDGTGNLWVGDYNSSQLIVLDKDGKEIDRLGILRAPGVAKDPEQVKTSVDIAVPGKLAYNAKRDQIWVCDSMNATIHIFDAKKRKYVKTIGGRQAKGGMNFDGISGIVFREDGSALCLDSMAGTIKEISPELKYVATYIDPKTKEKKRLQIEYPASITYHASSGHIYIVSTMLGKAYEYHMAK